MDYVVAGFGIGAILALGGFALWELFGNVDEPGVGWPSRTAIGLMLAALVIWAVTSVSLVSHIDDATGARLVLLTSLVSLLSVAAGSFWYWRADRALAEANPRPKQVSPQRELPVAVGVPESGRNIELDEWDSWPERTADRRDVAVQPDIPDEAPQPSFELEVAAEAVVQLDAVDTVDAVDAAEGMAAGPEEVAAPQAASAGVVVDPGSRLPSNVRPFRLAPPVAEPVAEDVLLAERVDGETEIENVEASDPGVVDEEVAASVEEVPEIDPNAQIALPAVEDALDEIAQQGSFESTLLADIDGSNVDEDGGYRSPLLSDLGSDQLEGVGLAKWRAEARLTDEENDEHAAPASRSSGR